MKIITCVGYHSTGSSVIDDYLREFSCVSQGGPDKECRLLQDPDGVSDLEYNLVENPHRLNSGYALKRFRAMMKRYYRNYSAIIGKDYMDLVDDYISKLTDLEYQGYWYADVALQPSWRRYIWYAQRVVNQLKPKRFRYSYWHSYFPEIKTIHCKLTEDEFLKITREFVDNLALKMAGGNAKKYIVLDQFVHPNNADRYLRYANDMKVIIVDRDPRDVYINHLRDDDHVLPIEPYAFCRIYRDSRIPTTDHYDESRVLYVKFEDMIYKYDEYTGIVRDFIGIDEKYHKRPKSRFKPEVSIKNTKQWEKYPEYKDAIDIIVKELPEYLYDFPGE